MTGCYTDALCFLAQTLMQLGRFEDAVGLITRSYLARSHIHDLYLNLLQVNIYLQLSQSQEARNYFRLASEMLQRALRKNPHNVFLANGCGVVLERMGKQQAAMHVFKRVRENALNFTSCCVNVAHLNLLEQRYNDAACLYRAALQAEDGKEDLELYLCLALALARGDNHREAFEVLQQAQKLRPEVAALSVCDG